MYVEADLPEMAARKRAALERIGFARASITASARSTPCETTTGRAASRRWRRELDPGEGLAIITEGLLGYLPTDAVAALWRRFARTLERLCRPVDTSPTCTWEAP